MPRHLWTSGRSALHGHPQKILEIQKRAAAARRPGVARSLNHAGGTQHHSAQFRQRHDPHTRPAAADCPWFKSGRSLPRLSPVVPNAPWTAGAGSRNGYRAAAVRPRICAPLEAGPAPPPGASAPSPSCRCPPDRRSSRAPICDRLPAGSVQPTTRNSSRFRHLDLTQSSRSLGAYGRSIGLPSSPSLSSRRIMYRGVMPITALTGAAPHSGCVGGLCGA
jgi:hypothetical protein